MMNRSLAGFLASALVAFSLVACGGSAEGDQVGTDEGAITSEPSPGLEAPAAPLPPEESAPTVDVAFGDTVSAGQCAGTLNQNQARNCTQRGQTFSASIVCSRCRVTSANITVTCTGANMFTAPTQAQLKTACGG